MGGVKGGGGGGVVKKKRRLVIEDDTDSDKEEDNNNNSSNNTLHHTHLRRRYTTTPTSPFTPHLPLNLFQTQRTLHTPPPILHRRMGWYRTTTPNTFERIPLSLN